MKKKNTIKLLGVLGALVVIYLIVIFTGGKGRSDSFRSVLVELDTAKISRVVISSPQATTEVTKTGSTWKVKVDDREKAAVAAVMDNLFSTLETAKPSRLVARSSDQWKDYTVDSAGTRYQIFEGNSKRLDLIIGRFGVEGQRNFHTYVRLFDDDDVYLSENFMGISLPKNQEDFRNGDVLRLKKDSLNQITFNYPDSAFTVYNQGNQWASPAFSVDSASIAKYIQTLGFVTSKSFVEGEELTTPDINITFGFSNQPEIQVSAYRRQNAWIIQSSENTDEFFTDSDVWSKLFVGPSQLVGS